MDGRRVTRARAAKAAAKEDQPDEAQLVEPAPPAAACKPASKIVTSDTFDPMFDEPRKTRASSRQADPNYTHDLDLGPEHPRIAARRGIAIIRGQGAGRGRGAANKAQEQEDLDHTLFGNSDDFEQQRKVKVVTEQNVV